MARRRHVPQRTCIGCRNTRDKRELLRIVRSPEGEIAFDPSGKRSGRGAYVCRDEACLQRALAARSLGAALKTEVTTAQADELKAALRAMLAGPEDGRPTS
ncbi:MAG TPA: YlxR family protein [Bacillota bacterium]